jgi:hypothetical protein
MFAALTTELLDLRAETRGSTVALFAMVVDCCSCCCCMGFLGW